MVVWRTSMAPKRGQNLRMTRRPGMAGRVRTEASTVQHKFNMMQSSIQFYLASGLAFFSGFECSYKQLSCIWSSFLKCFDASQLDWTRHSESTAPNYCNNWQSFAGLILSELRLGRRRATEKCNAGRVVFCWYQLHTRRQLKPEEGCQIALRCSVSPAWAENWIPTPENIEKYQKVSCNFHWSYDDGQLSGKPSISGPTTATTDSAESTTRRGLDVAHSMPTDACRACSIMVQGPIPGKAKFKMIKRFCHVVSPSWKNCASSETYILCYVFIGFYWLGIGMVRTVRTCWELRCWSCVSGVCPFGSRIRNSVMLSTAMQDLEMLSLSAQRLGNTAQRLCSNGVGWWEGWERHRKTCKKIIWLWKFIGGLGGGHRLKRKKCKRDWFDTCVHGVFRNKSTHLEDTRLNEMY